MRRAAGKDVLLIERFDRTHTKDGWTRHLMVSALTMLGLDEMMARYASYEDLAELIRHRFTDSKDNNFRVVTASSMALFTRASRFRWWRQNANFRSCADVRFREAANTAAVTGMSAQSGNDFRCGAGS
ncbi:MAG: hypothetical protein VR78_01285 [Hoeflea sp. BRH_c9]|nr:MAG: hypothetical protein VR78_01285 [Hoeflea sp. BRH_c9]